MSMPFEPSCHSCHPVPPRPKSRNHTVLALSILGALLLVALGMWGWGAYQRNLADKQAAAERDQSLLEAKARKDAAMLAEMGRRQEETGTRRAEAPEPHPQGWTETKAK